MVLAISLRNAESLDGEAYDSNNRKDEDTTPKEW
jgi:hypothetical protein